MHLTVSDIYFSNHDSEWYGWCTIHIAVMLIVLVYCKNLINIL